MYAVHRDTVTEWVTKAGGEVVDIEVLDEPSQWNCCFYTAVKR
jgi:hypothetical protein